MGESRSAFAPVFSTILGRSSNVTPPSNFLLGDRGVDVNDWFSSTGVRQRLPWGAGTWSVSWDTVADDDEQSDQQLRSEPAVRAPGRVLAAAAQGPQDRRRAAAVHHREAKPGELGAPLPRVGRPDRRGGQAGVLDAQGDRWRTSPSSSGRSSSRRSSRARTRSASMPGRSRRSISSRRKPRSRSGART